LVAALMVSSVATFSWKSLRLRRNVRFEALVLVVLIFAALVTAPWHTLAAISLTYLATLPFSIASYARIKRPRANAESSVAQEPTPSA
jgi:CDP-diacylglycerol--serine O-phosphatidyltransferase